MKEKLYKENIHTYDNSPKSFFDTTSKENERTI